MKKLTTPLLAALCLAAVAGLALFTTPDAAQAKKKAQGAPIGSDAPAFALPDVKTGKTVKLADHKGKVVVLMFHSTSCPWYRMREDGGYDRVFVKMVDAYKGKDVVFLGVNANRNETTDKIKKYIDKHSINYAVLKDEGNKIADAYGARVTPHVMIIDKAGKLRYRGGVEKVSGGPGNCGKSETQYLGPVVDALLKGEELTVPTETKASGCGIKKVKK